MVARTPPKLRKMVAPLNPVLVRETLKKVDQCMARLEELQYTVAGGRKVVAGVSLSPRSTRGYIKTSVRCKQESIRIKNSSLKKSPVGKFPPTAAGEWRRMSLPAMLVDETVGEILQASKFAREILAAIAPKPNLIDDPKTPMTQSKNQRSMHHPEDSELRTRRKREKQNKLRSEPKSPTLQRARSRINFKVSPPKQRDSERDNNRYMANRVSPRNRPWAKKTVLFPNPLFLPTTPATTQKFCKTRSPVIAKKNETPHKFLIKSPHSASKFQVKIKSPPKVCISPTRALTFSKNLPKPSTSTKLRRSFSPSRLANRLMSPLKSRKSVQKSDNGLMMRSFSPSRLANRLMSPLKSRKSVQKSDNGLMMSGLKQRPAVLTTPIRASHSRIPLRG
ncbi:hypothetical protein BT93_B1355 [Corymbia citriodora subsp. variegata]|nr:hypothetical protein BT93_B1355 [Corymbia citriodora subsp. variegata]